MWYDLTMPNELKLNDLRRAILDRALELFRDQGFGGDGEYDDVDAASDEQVLAELEAMGREIG